MRIKALSDGGSQRSYISKRFRNILSPDIIDKETIKITSFNNNNSKEEVSDSVKLSVKTEKGNKSIEAFCISPLWLSLKNQSRCEFCEIFKNTYFYRAPLLAASPDSGTRS